jgi:putative endopeptidase
MLVRRPLVLAVAASLVLCACAGAPSVTEAPPAPAADAQPTATPTPASASNQRGIDLGNFDKTIGACKDFYTFSNGNWLRANPVPAAFSSWGTFNELEFRNNERLRGLAVNAADRIDVAAGSPEALVGAFWAAAMDEDGIELRGLEPIQAELAAINTIDTPAAVAATIRDWQSNGIGVLFGFFSRQDLKDNTRVIAYASQGGLGLPNRDFYTREDAEALKLREQYVEHIAKQLTLGGTPAERASADAKAILALETRLAGTHLTREELRVPDNSYNLVKITEAERQTPTFGWRALFDANGLTNATEFSFSHPKFFAEAETALREVPVSTWQAYLRWNLLRQAAPNLPLAFADENFRFYGTVLRGQKEQRPRDQRTVEQMNGLLGEPLGQLFVAQYFPPEAKARMMEMIGHLKTSLRTRLERLEWMGDDTRREALEKWSTFTPKIGYPDVWRDYSGVTLVRDDHFGNVRTLVLNEHRRDMAKIGQPVDRSEWGMPPQQVNAYYNAVWNEIVFPAGILQPPFFDMQADDALNFGGIGAVIGHELLHGFDDQGSRFDSQGRLRMWWTADDRQRFDTRAQRLVDQAGEFAAIGDLRLNGRVSLGENIADLGGLQIAYAALEDALRGQPQTSIDGFTPQQRFFLGWSQVWRRNFTDEAMKIQVNVGPHAPGKFRTNGPLSNLPEFHRAFGCQDGDPMVRPADRRVAIW